MEKKGQYYVEMNAINWPKEYLPGTTDNFVSNEIIVKGISLKEVWPYLVDASKWPTYYSNSGDIKMYNQNTTVLAKDTKFHFSTFGFPIEAEVIEFVPPEDGKEADPGGHGLQSGEESPEGSAAETGSGASGLHRSGLPDLRCFAGRCVTADAVSETVKRVSDELAGSLKCILTGIAQNG